MTGRAMARLAGPLGGNRNSLELSGGDADVMWMTVTKDSQWRGWGARLDGRAMMSPACVSAPKPRWRTVGSPRFVRGLRSERRWSS